MIKLSPHHIERINKNYDNNYKEIRRSMVKGLLGAMFYDPKTVRKIIKFFRDLSSNLDNKFIVGKPGQLDSACELCCNYDRKRCKFPKIGSHKYAIEMEENYLKFMQWKPGEIRTVKDILDIDQTIYSGARILMRTLHRIDDRNPLKPKPI